MSNKLYKVLAVAGISMLASEEMCFADSIVGIEETNLFSQEDKLTSTKKTLVSPLFLQDMVSEKLMLEDAVPDGFCFDGGCTSNSGCR